MGFKIANKKLNTFLRALTFIGTIAIIAYLLPTQNTFKYQFELGKPWTYDLITAPFDFPVYKDEFVVRKERKEVLNQLIPFFAMDTALMHSQFDRFLAAIEDREDAYPKEIIWSKWKEIYQTGILSADQMAKLKHDNIHEINCVLPDKVVHKIQTDRLLTPKNAYELMINTEGLNLSGSNINLYLVDNLKFDSTLTHISKNELLKNISLTSGVIQTGERIIDRGEVVNEDQFSILNSMKIEYDKRKASLQRSLWVFIGEMIIIVGLMVLFFMYLKLFRPRIFYSFNNLLFINLLILIMVAISALLIQHTAISYFVIPFALLPIIIRVFFDPRTALFTHIIAISIISLIVYNPFQFLLIQIIVGMTAVSSLKDMTQRSQLAQSSLIIFLAYIITYLSLEFISEGEIGRIYWKPIIYFAISSGFLLFAYLLIYILEKIFGLISSITLLELTNINSDLMMQFAEKAPGTFQHTLQVSNLATDAAKKIGANSLLVRTGALYHDIGKMKNPACFIENQTAGYNPLDKMEFIEAAQKIIAHVQDGVEIAKKERLPEQIIHFITTHHGNSKVKYFYNSFINANPGTQPDKSLFTYPGPLPDTKETAILMMADAVEARARSLPEYTEASINNCVEEMIDSQIADGQFKDAPISFRDVETVKAIFKEKILNIYHTRIEYPEVNETN